jgi:hypothetical protein
VQWKGNDMKKALFLALLIILGCANFLSAKEIQNQKTTISPNFRVLKNVYAICHLCYSDGPPSWLDETGFISETRTIYEKTNDERSVLCPQNMIPLDTKCERNLRVLKIEAKPYVPVVSLISQVRTLLVKNNISILVFSTFDTKLLTQINFICVKQDDLKKTIKILKNSGNVMVFN